MNSCFFVSDLHGKMSRYEALFKLIKKEKPDFVFIGGDLLPHRSIHQPENDREPDFISDFLLKKLARLRDVLDCTFPDIYIIPGNDDYKLHFTSAREGEKEGLWRILHNQCVVIGKYRLYGYAFVPPTPFRLKDWEKYDVAKEVTAGCISPVDGYYTLPPGDLLNETIQADLEKLTGDDDLSFGIFLFHSPPFNTVLDQVETVNGNRMHVGSKAIRNLIDERQPYLTLHGHIHESARLSGEWKQTAGRTRMFSAAHDGPELALVKFELHDPDSATRMFVKV